MSKKHHANGLMWSRVGQNYHAYQLNRKLSSLLCFVAKLQIKFYVLSGL